MNFDVMQLFDLLMPVVTAIGGWLVGRRKRNNDFLSELQKSIDMLAAKNKELMDEVVILRKENANLLVNQEKMQTEITKLREENEQLRIEVEELNKHLAGVKTITRTK